LARLKKLDHPVSYSELSGFDSFQNKNIGAKLEDLKIQGVLMHEKKTKMYQETKMGEIQAKNRSRKNWIVRF
jgi:hypothetical protein